jgi:peptidoglycan/xylan/chitin deacetylase (PgdA/CDA1 family)
MPIEDWYSARDLLNRYGAKATFFINNFDQIPPEALPMVAALQSDGHEIACHGYRHIDAVAYVNGHSPEEYVNVEILPAINIMNNYGYYPTSFAYPGGSRDSTTDAILLGHFKVLRGVGNIGSPLGVAGTDLFYYKFNGEKVVYGAWTDNGGYTTEQFIMGLQRAKQNDEVLVTFGHMIRETSDQYATRPSKLEAILQYAKNNNIKYYKMSDLPS